MTAWAKDDSGFTLVELLITIVLMSVVSGVALTGLVQGLQTSDAAQRRIDAFDEVQIALERVARELRAADPVVSAAADVVVVQVHRGGTCTQHTFRFSGEALTSERRTSTDECATLGAPVTQTVVDDLEIGSGASRFTYTTAEAAPAATPADVQRIQVVLERTFRDQPAVTVTTLASVRNAS